MGRGMVRVGALSAWIALVCGAPTWGQQELNYEGEPISYLSAPVDDPVARLDAKLASGAVKLSRDRDRGYLPAVLEALGVPPESQALVFSKTSFQHTKISPQTPRALYFGDDVYIGWVRNSETLEVSAVDPRQGAVFYLLDQGEKENPRFERQTHNCLACHSSSKTQGVPGHLIRSVFTDTSGQPVYNVGSFLTDHASPMSERWGGWYVTGHDGGQKHMGNGVVRDRTHPQSIDDNGGADLDDLKGKLSIRPYLTPYSDIVALMVLEHQTQGHNRIAAASYHERLARYYDRGINRALGRPEDYLSPTSKRRIERASDDLVDYLLFVGEPELAAPIEGTSGFASKFGANARRDARGRSLRDFDLKARLFRYPLSFLVETEAFDALPASVLDRVRERFRAILSGEDDSPKYAHLDGDTRRAIREVLQASKPGFLDDPGK
ncbi:MAG: hypothetical protein U0800_19500 [Isosphaeraceae bacterium]